MEERAEEGNKGGNTGGSTELEKTDLGEGYSREVTKGRETGWAPDPSGIPKDGSDGGS